MSIKKNPCINYPSCTYTGKEQSPLGFGLSAEGYAVNSVIEGNDKHYWVVEFKNNKKVWVKKDQHFRITPEEPVIKPIDTETIIQHNTETVSSVTGKKTTDYNLYLSYRLKQLKELSVDADNKTNFNKVIEEWKVIKNKPEMLKDILEEAKKYSELKPIKKVTTKPIKKVSVKSSKDIELQSDIVCELQSTNDIDKSKDTKTQKNADICNVEQTVPQTIYSTDVTDVQVVQKTKKTSKKEKDCK